MLDWFRRLRRVTRRLVLPSRDASTGRSGQKLNPAKLTPDADYYLARLSYLLETAAEVLESQSHVAPNANLAAKQREIAKKYQAKSKALDLMLEKFGVEPQAAKDLVSESIEQFHQYTLGRGWYENLIRLYIGYGILEHLYQELSVGLSPAKRVQVEAILNDQSLPKFAKETLEKEISSNANLAAQLALFSRSIVADVLLEVRNSVSLSKLAPNASQPEAFKILEPLVSELISAHTQRMDGLGLTA